MYIGGLPDGPTAEEAEGFDWDYPASFQRGDLEEGHMEEILSKSGFICDMDCVIYRGSKVLPGVPEFIHWRSEPSGLSRQ